MKYIVKTTVGIGFVFRCVRDIDYDAEKRSLRVKLAGGIDFTAHGVSSIKGVEDDEPHGSSFNVIHPSRDGGSYEFPRETEVPIELKAAPAPDALTVACMAQSLRRKRESFASEVLREIRNSRLRGVTLQ